MIVKQIFFNKYPVETDIVASYVNKYDDTIQYELVYVSDIFYINHPFKNIYTPKDFIEWISRENNDWELKIYNQDLFLIAKLMN